MVVRAFLKLNMSRTIADDTKIRMHRVLPDWQEGQGIGFGNEGPGAAAVDGDVSWTHTKFDSLDWDQPGGDFFPVASAAATVGGEGPAPENRARC